MLKKLFAKEKADGVQAEPENQPQVVEEARSFTQEETDLLISVGYAKSDYDTYFAAILRILGNAEADAQFFKAIKKSIKNAFYAGVHLNIISAYVICYFLRIAPSQHMKLSDEDKVALDRIIALLMPKIHHQNAEDVLNEEERKIFSASLDILKSVVSRNLFQILSEVEINQDSPLVNAQPKSPEVPAKRVVVTTRPLYEKVSVDEPVNETNNDVVVKDQPVAQESLAILLNDAKANSSKIEAIFDKDSVQNLRRALLAFKAQYRMSKGNDVITKAAGGKLATGMEAIVEKIDSGASIAAILIYARDVAIKKETTTCSSKFFTRMWSSDADKGYAVLRDYLSVKGKGKITTSDECNQFIAILKNSAPPPRQPNNQVVPVAV